VSGFLWTSERDGPSRLYLWEAGSCGRSRTAAGCSACLDRQRRALVSGWFETPTEQHLYEVSLDGGADAAATDAGPGLARTGGRPRGQLALPRSSSLTSPGELWLVDTGANAAPAAAAAWPLQWSWTPRIPISRT
jgi:hypothetical protein